MCKDSCGWGGSGTNEFTCTFRQSYWPWVLQRKAVYSTILRILAFGQCQILSEVQGQFPIVSFVVQIILPPF